MIIIDLTFVCSDHRIFTQITHILLLTMPIWHTEIGNLTRADAQMIEFRTSYIKVNSSSGLYERGLIEIVWKDIAVLHHNMNCVIYLFRKRVNTSSMSCLAKSLLNWKKYYHQKSSVLKRRSVSQFWFQLVTLSHSPSLLYSFLRSIHHGVLSEKRSQFSVGSFSRFKVVTQIK